MPRGWSDERVARVKNVQLPQTIKCMGCHKPRGHSSYSNRQLAGLRGKVVYSGQHALTNHGLRCNQCTGAESNEITCIRCDKLKLADDFFKAQRSNRDTATCINCVSDGLSARPWDGNCGEEAGGSDDGYHSHDNDDDNSTIGGRSIAGGVMVRSRGRGDAINETSSMSSRPSLPSSMGLGLDDDDDYDEDDSESVHGGAFLEDDPSQNDTLSIAHSSITQSSAVSSSIANEDSQASASLRQPGDVGDYGWQRKEKRPSRPKPMATSKPGGKWAKIRAHDPCRDAQKMRIPEPSEMADEDDQRSLVGTSVAPSESYY